MAVPAYICVECGVTAEPRHLGTGSRSFVVFAFLVGVGFLWWGLTAPVIYGAAVIGFGVSFVLVGALAEFALSLAERRLCTSCFSPRVVPTTSPVGRRVVYTLGTTAEGPAGREGEPRSQ